MVVLIKKSISFYRLKAVVVTLNAVSLKKRYLIIKSIKQIVDKTLVHKIIYYVIVKCSLMLIYEQFNVASFFLTVLINACFST